MIYLLLYWYPVHGSLLTGLTVCVHCPVCAWEGGGGVMCSCRRLADKITHTLPRSTFGGGFLYDGYHRVRTTTGTLIHTSDRSICPHLMI